MTIWTFVVTFVVACALALFYGAFVNAGWDIASWPRDSRLGSVVAQLTAWWVLVIVAYYRKQS